AELLPVEPALPAEADPFLLQQLALQRGEAGLALDRDLAVPVHHPPPGHGGLDRQRAERRADAARRARGAEDRRDAAVAHGPSARDAADERVHAGGEILRHAAHTG